MGRRRCERQHPPRRHPHAAGDGPIWLGRSGVLRHRRTAPVHRFGVRHARHLRTRPRHCRPPSRPGPRARAARAGRRRKDLRVSTAPRHPLLRRKTAAGRRLPPGVRASLPARLAGRRPLREHRRRGLVPEGPCSLQPRSRDRHRRPGRHRHLPPEGARSGLPVRADELRLLRSDSHRRTPDRTSAQRRYRGRALTDSTVNATEDRFGSPGTRSSASGRMRLNRTAIPTRSSGVSALHTKPLWKRSSKAGRTGRTTRSPPAQLHALQILHPAQVHANAVVRRRVRSASIPTADSPRSTTSASGERSTTQSTERRSYRRCTAALPSRLPPASRWLRGFRATAATARTPSPRAATAAGRRLTSLAHAASSPPRALAASSSMSGDDRTPWRCRRSPVLHRERAAAPRLSHPASCCALRLPDGCDAPGSPTVGRR